LSRCVVGVKGRGSNPTVPRARTWSRPERIGEREKESERERERSGVEKEIMEGGREKEEEGENLVPTEENWRERESERKGKGK
jgi:hypothetical protein